MNLRRLIAPTIKSILNRFAPDFASAWQSRREDRHGQKVMRDLGVTRLVEQFTKKHGWIVQAGPFAGMRFESSSVGSALLPKLVGAYEQELHSVISEALQHRYEVVADVGSAEGYYAVGLARFGQVQGQVHAFDINKKARKLCKSLATANEVLESVVVEERCDPSVLGQLISGRRGLVISDCEGYEALLFDVTNIRSLNNCDVMIELHETRSPGVTEYLKTLFWDTHDLQMISMSERDPGKYPLLSVFSEPERQLALSEFRGETQQWLVARPHQR